MSFRLRVLLIKGFMLLAAVSAILTRAQTDLAPTYADVPYVPDGDPSKHVLDIYVPPGEGLFPVVFMIHCNGCSKWDYHPQAARFLDLGYATVAIEYRNVAPRSPLGPLADSFCALAWVHDYGAEYRLDSSRIVVFGHSLGGYAAAMLAAVDEPDAFMEDCPNTLPAEDRMQGVVIYAGALWGVAPRIYPLIGDMSKGEAENALETLAALPPSDWRDSPTLTEDQRRLAQLLPFYWIDGSEPPTLIFHGTIDNLVPIEESEMLAGALDTAGVEVQFVRLAGAGHGIRLYQRVPTPEVDAAMEDFLAAVFERE